MKSPQQREREREGGRERERGMQLWEMNGVQARSDPAIKALAKDTAVITPSIHCWDQRHVHGDTTPLSPSYFPFANREPENKRVGDHLT